MAYTRDWNTEVLGKPVGSRASSELDDAIREFKVDLDERLQDIVVDPSADPWQLKGVGLVARYSWALGYAGIPSSGTVGAGNFVNANANGAGMTVYMPINVPTGARLVSVKFRLNVTGAGAAATAQVFKNSALGAPSSLGIVATAPVGAGWADYDIGPVSDVASAGESYIAFVALTNGTGTFGEFMDMEVTIAGE